MKITSASKKVLASALSAAMVVAFAPTVAFAGESTTQQPTSVASVTSADGKNVVYYEDLEAALTAAAAGTSVKLLADVADETLDEGLKGDATLAVKAGVNFDGGNHVIKSTKGKVTINAASGDTEGAAPTVIQNFTVVDNTDKDKDSKLVAGDDAAEYVTVANVTIDIVDANGMSTLAGVTSDLNNLGGEAIVESGTYGVVVNDATMTVKGGSFTGVENKDTLTVKGGTFAGGLDNTHAYVYALKETGPKKLTTVVKGGTFSGFMSLAKPVTASIEGGTFVDDPTDWLAAGKVATKNEDKTYTVGTGVAIASATVTSAQAAANVANSILYADNGAGTGPTLNQAKKAAANAGTAWAKEIAEMKLPAALTLDENQTMADLYQAVKTVTVTSAVDDYATVKNYTASSTAAQQKKKALYEAVDAAVAAAGLTSVKSAADDNDAKTTEYNKYFTLATAFAGVSTASTLGEGNELTLAIETNNVADYSANYAYSLVYSDGTAVKGEVVKVTATSTGTGLGVGEYLVFKTAKMGTASIAYKDTVAETKTELEQAKAEAEQAKKDLEAAKAELEAAKAPVAMTTYKSFKASTVKKAAQTVTVAKGAKVVKVKTSSSKITVKSNKIKVAKGTKKGTYTAKVKVTPSGQATSTVTVTIVVK